LESYRAATLNLGTNTFVVENLPDPIKKKSGRDPQSYMDVVAIPEGYTIWDKVHIRVPGLTVQQLIDTFAQVHHGCKIDMISTPSGTIIFNELDAYDPSKRLTLEAKRNTSVVELYQSICGPIFPADRKYLIFDVTVETASGDTGVVPFIIYHFA